MFSRFNKYFGDRVCGLLESNVESWPWFSSSWWKDITSLELSVGVNWFNREVLKRIDNGLNTKFWHDSWAGIDPLRVNFSRLFSLTNQKEAKGGDLWELIDGVQVWSLEWRRNICVGKCKLRGSFRSLGGKEANGGGRCVVVECGG